MPPWPTTRAAGRPLASRATWHIASIGLAKITKTASGDCSTACETTERTMPALVASRSSRVMPGLRGTPEVTMTTSDPALSRHSVEPVTRTEEAAHGLASWMSSALPAASPSTMSMSTTSA